MRVSTTQAGKVTCSISSTRKDSLLTRPPPTRTRTHTRTGLAGVLQEDRNTSKFETAAGLAVVCLLKYADLLLICFIFTN